MGRTKTVIFTISKELFKDKPYAPVIKKELPAFLSQLCKGPLREPKDDPDDIKAQTYFYACDVDEDEDVHSKIDSLYSNLSKQDVKVTIKRKEIDGGEEYIFRWQG